MKQYKQNRSEMTKEVGEETTRVNVQVDAKETKQFQSKILKQNIKNAECNHTVV